MYERSRGSARPAAAACSRTTRIAAATSSSRAHLRGLRRAGQLGRTQHRHPTLRPLSDSAPAALGVATDPDGNRVLRRPGSSHDVTCVEVSALIAERLPAPMQGKAIEHLVEQHIAFVHVDAKGVELRLLIAGSKAQDEPAARQPVERGGCLGEHERIAVGRQRQVGEQLQTFGGRRDVAQGHERIEALVSTGSQPAGTRDGVFGQRDAVEAGFFGCTCHLVE